MTEAEARAALAAFDHLDGLERWIAAQAPLGSHAGRLDGATALEGQEVP